MKKYSHNYGDYELEKALKSTLPTVENSLKNIEVTTKPEVKQRIRDIFHSWDKRGKNTKSLNLKYGFRRGKIQAEIQFGNVARFYADVMKMEQAYRDEKIKYGLLILPNKETAKAMGSNLANFEKARDELREMRDIITMPMIVYGI